VGDSVIPDVALSADGTVLAAHVDAGHSTPGHLVWAGPPDWKERDRVRLPVRGMSLAIDPAGRWAAVGDEKGQVQVHARAGGKPTLLKAHKDWVRGLAVSADGKTLAALGGDTLVAWDTATWKPRAKFKDGGSVIDVDGRGTRVVSAVAFGALDKPKQGDRATIARVYDLASGKVVRDVEVPGFSISHARVLTQRQEARPCRETLRDRGRMTKRCSSTSRAATCSPGSRRALSRSTTSRSCRSATRSPSPSTPTPAGRSCCGRCRRACGSIEKRGRPAPRQGPVPARATTT
jgi:hypothetical protein